MLHNGCGRNMVKPNARPPHAEGISTLTEFNAVLARHAENLDERFRIQCSPKLHALLMEPSLVPCENYLLSEILMMNGSDGRLTISWIDDTLELGPLYYYAGWRILNAFRNGSENVLDARERETLRVAQSIVAAASGSPVEKERQIHDALCNRIVYYKDEGRGEKDCAVGALLNGKADCSGYADAMLLCCGLAGIPCRYMSGKARETGEETDSGFSKEASHGWNLVKIAESWVSVDVTWADQTNYISYLYYNLGTADASLSYLWDSRALPVKMAVETDCATQLMPDQRRAVIHSLEDVYLTARKATTEDAHRVTFLCAGTPLWKTAEAEFLRMLSYGGWSIYSYSKRGRMLEVTNLQTKPNIIFCDTEEDALHAIGDFASAGEHSFSLYFRPTLAEALFAEERAGLKRLLSRSLLEDPDSFCYSRESGSVSMENASFLKQPLPVCLSEKEIRSFLRRELARKPKALAFLLPDGFDFTAVKDRVFTCVYSMGVKNYALFYIGNRIKFADLKYHPEFCLAKTRGDVESYLRLSRKSGKTNVRVFCSPELYSELKADKARAFWEMLKEAGYTYTGCKVFHNDRPCMLRAEWSDRAASGRTGEEDATDNE